MDRFATQETRREEVGNSGKRREGSRREGAATDSCSTNSKPCYLRDVLSARGSADLRRICPRQPLNPCNCIESAVEAKDLDDLAAAHHRDVHGVA